MRETNKWVRVCSPEIFDILDVKWSNLLHLESILYDRSYSILVICVHWCGLARILCSDDHLLPLLSADRIPGNTPELFCPIAGRQMVLSGAFIDTFKRYIQSLFCLC